MEINKNSVVFHNLLLCCGDWGWHTHLQAVIIINVSLAHGPAALLTVQPECFCTDPLLQIRHPGGANIDDPRTQSWNQTQVLVQISDWFVALQCKTIHHFVMHLWGHKFVSKNNQQNPRTLIPHKQKWFHSTQFLVFHTLAFGYKIVPTCCHPHQENTHPSRPRIMSTLHFLPNAILFVLDDVPVSHAIPGNVS